MYTYIIRFHILDPKFGFYHRPAKN